MDIEGILPLIAMSEISLWNRHVCVTIVRLGRYLRLAKSLASWISLSLLPFLSDPGTLP